jgi:hypothetical protein
MIVCWEATTSAVRLLPAFGHSGRMISFVGCGAHTLEDSIAL